MLEVLEHAGERVRIEDAWLGVSVFGAEVDQRVARDHDRHLVLVQVLELGNGLGIGEPRTVHDDLARVQVFMDRRAGTAA